MSETFLDRHRGPYRLVVTRPAKKPGFYQTEWLTGATDRDNVESEARALLADPRDTVTRVDLWSLREDCFVGGYTQ